MSKHVKTWRLPKPKRSLHLLPGPELLGNVSSSKQSHFAFLRGWIPRIIMRRRLQPLAFQPDSNSMNNAAGPSKHPCQVTQVPLVGKAFYSKRDSKREYAGGEAADGKGSLLIGCLITAPLPRRAVTVPKGACALSTGLEGTIWKGCHTVSQHPARTRPCPATP